MRLIKYSCIIVIFTMILTLYSCNQGGEILGINIAPTNQSISEITSRVYDDATLLEIVGFNGTMNELDSQYPIECLRMDGDRYRCAFLGQRQVAIVLFDSSGNKLLGKIHKLQNFKSDFNELVVGCSLEDVQKVDPNGEYLFLYTGRNDTPRISSHYTEDGWLITIKYNEENMIESITQDLI